MDSALVRRRLLAACPSAPELSTLDVLNIDSLQTVITRHAAESDDVDYYLVRRAGA